MSYGYPVAEATDLADRINDAHREAEGAARSAIGHAITCGLLLEQAKDECPRGDWLHWLGEHFTGAERTAQLYMKLARSRDQLAGRELTLREAAAVVARPPAPPAPPTPPEPDPPLTVDADTGELFEEASRDVPAEASATGGGPAPASHGAPHPVAEVVPALRALATRLHELAGAHPAALELHRLTTRALAIAGALPPGD